MITFDWSHFLILSNILYDDVRKSKNTLIPEAKLRTAVNRAYYASYWQARIYLSNVLNDHSIPDNADAHYYLPKKFINTNEVTFKEIGNNLKRIFKLRKEVDYKEFVDELPQKTMDSLNYAKDIENILYSKKLIVKGLNKNTSEEEIKKHFACYGTINFIKLIKDKRICFLTMNDLSEADNAKVSLDNSILDGYTIKVEKAIPKT